MSSWAALPTDMQIAVLACLPSWTVRATSHAFRQCADAGRTTLWLDGDTGDLRPTDLRPRLHMPSLTSAVMTSVLDVRHTWDMVRQVCDVGALTSVSMRHCVMSPIDVSSLVMCTTLTCLDLEGCVTLTDVAVLSACPRLMTLRVEGCHNLTGLASCPSLTTLEAAGCTALCDLQTLTGCLSLSTLDLCGCRQVASVVDVARCSSLTSLNLDCTLIEDLDSLLYLTYACTWLPSITSLWLESCDSVGSLALLARCTSLTSLVVLSDTHVSVDDLSPLASCRATMQHLRLSTCRAGTQLAPLASLSRLTALELSSCSDVSDLDFIAASCESLLQLDLHKCWCLTDIRAISLATSVTRLDLKKCIRLDDLRPLAACTRLVWLDLGGCPTLADLAPLSSCTSLTSLALSRCGVTDISALASCLALSWISLHRCGVYDLSPLKALRHLESLLLSYCKRLSVMDPVAALPLTRLRIIGSRCLAGIASVAGLRGLTDLHLSYTNLCQTSAEPLALCLQLQHLSLQGNELLRSVGVLADGPSKCIRVLNLSWCKSLEDIAPLAGCRHLVKLDISHSRRIRDIRCLASGPSLTLAHVDLSWCARISDVSPLAGCPSLTFVDITGCTRVTDRVQLDVRPRLRFLWQSEDPVIL